MKPIILLFFTVAFAQYYNLNIEQTGESHLLVLQETISLNSGWEIGIFDQQGIINNGNCETEYGELLVASGVWDGSQLDLSAIGSIDFCQIGGEQHSGFIEDNEIFIRVYDPFENIEYTTTYLTFDGIEPSFEGLYSVILDIFIDDIYAYNSINQQLIIKNFSLNNIYPNPANPMINIDYELKMNSKINFSIFGINGKLLYNFKSQEDKIGKYAHYIDLIEIPSGIYFLKMNSAKNSTIQKFTVLK